MHVDEYLPVLQKTNCRMDDAAAEAVLAHGWSAHVSACPGWRLADLVRHVAEVQHFWAWVVRTRAIHCLDRRRNISRRRACPVP